MTKTTKTTAQQISSSYNDDGQQWDDEDGIHIEEACGDIRDVVVDKSEAHDLARYTFADGSAILIMGGGWDFGFADR